MIIHCAGMSSDEVERWKKMLMDCTGRGTRHTIIAEIDPENRASERIVEKLGFRKGEILKEGYQTGIDVQLGNSRKRYHQRWYLQRPSS